MTVSEDLADLLKNACRQVDAWESWKRSRDSQASETEEDLKLSSSQSSSPAPTKVQV